MTSRSNCEGLLSTRLEEILESDDDARLVNLLRDHPNSDVDIINSLVNECVESDAYKCLFALIRGHVCNMHPTFDHLPDNTCAVTALAYVAHSCPDSQVINLMLTKCRATSLANLGCTIGSVHGLPIHFLLINLSLVEPLYFWYRGDSLLKLVFLLCYWETVLVSDIILELVISGAEYQMSCNHLKYGHKTCDNAYNCRSQVYSPFSKPILDSLRVLVKYTDSINDIALTILKNGGLRQFTALLLIAREKVIAPFDSGLTIHHYITAEIESIPKGKLNVEQEEYKCIFMDAQSLLALFDKTGDDLSSYCSSMQKPFFRSRPYRKSMPIPKLKCLQHLLYTTGACQARKMSTSIPHTGVSPLLPYLGYIPLKFIKRIRFL
ncbi:hypothetical protein RND81_07G204000 [Saponaria officinalis]|uniref:Uncharacterized protein n=1 Tax=Saponaria officinalis TaxID=3572 RepID=A0AAW1JTR8_SAPOF